MCAVVRDEAPYLRESCLFCLLAGVERYWLYDNGSRDDWRAAVPELAGDVFDWPGTGVQVEAHENCLRHQADTDWVAFVDIDEFLLAPDGRTLPEVLAGHPDAAAIEVPWGMFGDRGHREQPSALTVDAFLRCAPEQAELGKMIVRPGRVGAALTPHTFDVRPSLVARDPGLVINH